MVTFSFFFTEVKIFVALEQRNFSLLTYVNALNREIEALDKQNRQLKDLLLGDLKGYLKWYLGISLDTWDMCQLAGFWVRTFKYGWKTSRIAGTTGQPARNWSWQREPKCGREWGPTVFLFFVSPMHSELLIVIECYWYYILIVAALLRREEEDRSSHGFEVADRKYCCRDRRQ